MLRVLVHLLLVFSLATPSARWSCAVPDCGEGPAACVCCPVEVCDGCQCSADDEPAPAPERQRAELPHDLSAMLPWPERLHLGPIAASVSVGVVPVKYSPARCRAQALTCRWLT